MAFPGPAMDSANGSSFWLKDAMSTIQQSQTSSSAMGFALKEAQRKSAFLEAELARSRSMYNTLKDEMDRFVREKAVESEHAAQREQEMRQEKEGFTASLHDIRRALEETREDFQAAQRNADAADEEARYAREEADALRRELDEADHVRSDLEADVQSLKSRLRENEDLLYQCQEQLKAEQASKAATELQADKRAEGEASKAREALAEVKLLQRQLEAEEAKTRELLGELKKMNEENRVARADGSRAHMEAGKLGERAAEAERRVHAMAAELAVEKGRREETERALREEQERAGAAEKRSQELAVELVAERARREEAERALRDEQVRMGALQAAEVSHRQAMADTLELLSPHARDGEQQQLEAYKGQVAALERELAAMRSENSARWQSLMEASDERGNAAELARELERARSAREEMVRQLAATEAKASAAESARAKAEAGRVKADTARMAAEAARARAEAAHGGCESAHRSLERASLLAERECARLAAELRHVHEEMGAMEEEGGRAAADARGAQEQCAQLGRALQEAEEELGRCHMALQEEAGARVRAEGELAKADKSLRSLRKVTKVVLDGQPVNALATATTTGGGLLGVPMPPPPPPRRILCVNPPASAPKRTPWNWGPRLSVPRAPAAKKGGARGKMRRPVLTDEASWSTAMEALAAASEASAEVGAVRAMLAEELATLQRRYRKLVADADRAGSGGDDSDTRSVEADVLADIVEAIQRKSAQIARLDEISMQQQAAVGRYLPQYYWP